MKEFLSTYIELLQNNHDMVGQVSYYCNCSHRLTLDMSEACSQEFTECNYNDNAFFDISQVHSEFKRQFLEMTVDKLLEQFVLSKYTGLEKPGMF